ncbi:ankyrin repeat domain-containing protein 16 [Eurytemora carolleeae]|uniref:ankyrin repeat domain-containing protein 16 n=1 Tax=Eurytemora carolleeae TaxID=1294199 RepID=UPI000C788143|nr:ankyrin repeat domain-containing protein 16 [Eurytemora carolleeae]XP_023343430.1 ankyrin repeat domain-containing protein 16 [Eurytemora carolleeae]|eukprot:XP_023343429.1 ankyrin repeat domain-containing protein 16-like [Eurytemora affinis]
MNEKIIKDLLSAAQEGNLKTFSNLLYQFNLNQDLGDFGKIAHKKSGDAILHILARNGHISCLRFLVQEFVGKKFVDLEIRNLDGKTPLHEACQQGEEEFVQELLSLGVQVDQLKRADWTPAMLAVTHPGRLGILKLLVKQAANLNIQNKDGWTSFHVAARTGDLEVLLFILEQEPTAWSIVSKNGRTPLHTAALHASYQTVDFLLSVGCSCNSMDSCGTTPLMDAVRANSVESTQLILRRKDLNRSLRDSVGRSPVHVAAQAGAVQCLKLLLEDGFGLDVKTRDGQSALHCAAREGQLVTVNFILGQGGLINLRDVNGRTSLFLAISGQHVETCKSLLEAGAELFTDKSYLNLEELARKPELKRLIAFHMTRSKGGGENGILNENKTID